MTVYEMIYQKYLDWLKNISEREWKRIKEDAEMKKQSVPEYMLRCIEITENDCNPRKNADVYWELIEMNKNKLIASNRHKNYHGKINAFWLTKKGYKQLFT